jgi:DNA invertase Pin-like site-specific DNA recombinase
MIITIICDIYLRLSDFRNDDADTFGARKAKLLAMAESLGWRVNRVIVENDVTADGAYKPASAYKRRKITTPAGNVEWRVLRDGWRDVIADLTNGTVQAVLAEDLDRVARDPRDIEDLIDAVQLCRGHARSLSGSLTLTNGGSSDQIAMARVMVTMAAKSSADTARRVADGRERTARLGSYGGGPRPFGYRSDPDAPKYAKTLIIVQAEAEVIRAAADAILAERADDRKSLAYLARELREGDVPTVTGAAWTAETLRDIMIKPALAGIAVNTRTGVETANAWPAIIEPEIWLAVRAKLTDPARRTNANGNAPRWLGTNLYLCGVCADGTSVQVHGGREKAPGYVCKGHAHLRRNAEQVDKYVLQVLADKLSRPDAADLFQPAPRGDVDVTELYAKRKRLETIGARQAQMHALGEITDAEFKAGSKTRQEELASIAAKLSAVSTRDELAEVRGISNPEEMLKTLRGLPLARQRDILSRIAVVTLERAGRRGSGFDESSVRIVPKV